MECVLLYKFLAAIFLDVTSSPLIPAEPDFGNANVRTFLSSDENTGLASHGRARALIARAITGVTPGVAADLRRI